MDKNAKIYIAGHRGLVGSAIFRKLQMTGYNNLITKTHKELDLKRQADVEAFFESEKPAYVFLAAARVGGILSNNTYPADFIYDNIMIQSNIIHSAYFNSAKKLVFFGSSCIYPKECSQPMKEDYLLTGLLEPTNEPYAIAKISGIKMCQSYNRQYGTNFISVMPTNLYGPHDNFDLEASHVLPALIRKCHLAKLASQGKWDNIRTDEKIFGPLSVDFKTAIGINPLTNQPVNQFTPPQVVLWGTGDPKREFLHVDDLAGACIYIMEHYDKNEILNIGVGEDIRIRDLADLVAEIVGFEGDISFDPSKPDGTQQKLLDISRLKSFGWKACISLREGIKQTYDWYLSVQR